jgi:hypothetical protein
MYKGLSSIVLVFLLAACVAVDKEAEITLVRQGLPRVSSIAALNSPCAAGQICSFQITGADLGKVTRVTIDTGAATQNLAISAQNDGTILAETVAALTIPINSLVEFTVQNARGLAAIPVNFTIPANSITLAEIDVSTIASELVAGSSGLLMGNQNPVYSGTLTGQSFSATGTITYTGANITYLGNAFFNFQDSGGTEVIEMRPGVDIGMSIKDGANLYIENGGQIQVGGDLGTATAPKLTIDGSTGNLQTTGGIISNGTFSVTGNADLSGSTTIRGLLQTGVGGDIDIANGRTLSVTSGNLTSAIGTTVDLDGATNIATLDVDGGGLTVSAGDVDITAGGINLSGGSLDISGAANGININDGAVVIGGAGGNLTVAQEATIGTGVTVTSGDLNMATGNIFALGGIAAKIQTNGAFEVVSGATTRASLTLDSFAFSNGSLHIDNGSASLTPTGAGGRVRAMSNLETQTGNVIAENGNIVATNGTITSGSDILSVNGNISADLGALVAGPVASAPLLQGFVYANQGVIAENGPIEANEGYVYAGVGGSTPANAVNGTITSEGDIYSDQGSLILPTANTAGVGPGGINGQYINLPIGPGPAVSAVTVGSGNIVVQNGDVSISGSSGAVPGPGNGDFTVAGEATINGALEVGPAAINLSGVFSAAIAGFGTRSFSVLDIGSTAVTAEVAVVMYGGGLVVAGRYFCVIDLEGHDAPDVFQSECEDLSDIGNFGGDPLDLSATLSGGAPTTGITFSLTNNTPEILNGSVNIRITRARADALKPFLNGI